MTTEEKDVRTGIIIDVMTSLWKLLEYYPMLQNHATALAQALMTCLIDPRVESNKNTHH
jgi:hypothetical protein